MTLAQLLFTLLTCFGITAIICEKHRQAPLRWLTLPVRWLLSRLMPQTGILTMERLLNCYLCVGFWVGLVLGWGSEPMLAPASAAFAFIVIETFNTIKKS